LRGLTSRAVGEKSQKVTRGSHRNDVSPLTQGLRYRAACDTSCWDAGSFSRCARCLFLANAHVYLVVIVPKHLEYAIAVFPNVLYCW